MGNKMFCSPVVVVATMTSSLQDESVKIPKSTTLSVTPTTLAGETKRQQQMATNQGLPMARRSNLDSSKRKFLPNLTIVTDFSSQEMEAYEEDHVSETRFQFNFSIEKEASSSGPRRRQRSFHQLQQQQQQREPTITTTTPPPTLMKQHQPFHSPPGSHSYCCDEPDRWEGKWIIVNNQNVYNVPDDISAITCRSDDFIVPYTL
jgi:hypothetical protein